MNIAVLSCKNIKDETCIACHRCLMGFDKKEGEFERYKDTDAKLTLTLQKSRMPQILGVEGEAVVLYREPSTTQ